MVARLGREGLKYAKYAVLRRQRNPGTVVGNGEHAVTPNIRNRDGDAPGGEVVMLDGVVDEITQHAF